MPAKASATFEPPHFGEGSTGGMVAGFVRPVAPAWRCATCAGLEMINGQGELLRYGGQVAKNVGRAMTSSRPMTGS